MQTKRGLRKRIEFLEEELDLERRKTRESAFIDAAGLPKCKSLACVECEHIVYQQSPHGDIFVLGCGKDNSCSDFVKKEKPIIEEARRSLRSSLLSQGLL